MWHRCAPVGSVLVVVAVITGACNGTTDVTMSPPGRTTPTTQTTAATTTAAADTTKTVPSAATSSPVDPCDPAPLLAAVDAALVAARLSAATWAAGPGASQFAARTTPAEDFAVRHAFDCSLLAAHPGSDTDRLLLAAWTGNRMAWVVQATDQPAVPYEESVRVDLLLEQPWGEWVAEDVWAVTLATGETLVIGTVDYSLGAAAKSWLVDYPEPPSPPPQLPAEEYAWPLLEAAGARNVGIAEPSETTVASLAFSTPLGNVMVATVGPLTDFDPIEGYLRGERRLVEISGTSVQFSLAGEGQFGVAEGGFLCSSWGWRLEAAMGTVDELTGFLRALIPILDC